MSEGLKLTEKQIKAGYYYAPKKPPPVHVGMFVVEEGKVSMPGSQFELYRRITVAEKPIKIGRGGKITILPSVSKRKAPRKKEIPTVIPVKPRPGSLFEEYARKYAASK